VEETAHDDVATRMTALSQPQIDYLATQRLGRLATTGADSKPHVVPTSFSYNADLGTIDVGGMRVAATKKY
jgi:pyridoxamine 5'-phosphate oxidase family protein